MTQLLWLGLTEFARADLYWHVERTLQKVDAFAGGVGVERQINVMIAVQLQS